jgi:hypothetical protein
MVDYYEPLDNASIFHPNAMGSNYVDGSLGLLLWLVDARFSSICD